MRYLGYILGLITGLDQTSPTLPDICEDSSWSEHSPPKQPQTNPQSPPHQKKTQRDPLEGLPQYDEAAYGCRRHRQPPAVNSAIADLQGSATGLDDEDSIDPEGTDVTEQVFASIGDEPLLEDALSGSETCDWHDAIEVELSQVEKLWTFDLVIPPPDANIIPSGYAFCRKQNEDGKIIQYKARLIAKGYRQHFGIDYSDTYAPMSALPLSVSYSHLLRKNHPSLNKQMSKMCT